MSQENGLINVDALNDAERMVLADMLVSSVQDDSMFSEDDKALLRQRIEDGKSRSGAYVPWEEARAKLFAKT